MDMTIIVDWRFWNCQSSAIVTGFFFDEALHTLSFKNFPEIP
jgi:hypothetical protein